MDENQMVKGTTVEMAKLVTEAYLSGMDAVISNAKKECLKSNFKTFVLGALAGGVVMTAVCLHLWNEAENNDEPTVEEEVPYPEQEG